MKHIDSQIAAHIGDLKFSSREARESAADALVSFGLPALSHLCEVLRSNDSEAREVAAKSIRRICMATPSSPVLFRNHPVTKLLCQALGDKRQAVRLSMADVMGVDRNRCFVGTLLMALKDSDCDVRIAAAHALGKIADVRAVEPLRCLLNDSHIYVRAHAVQALCSFTHSVPTETFLGVMRRGDWGVSWFAKQALVKCGAASIGVLGAEVQGRTNSARHHLAEVLVKFDCADANAALRRAAEGDEQFSRFVTSLKEELYWSQRQVQTPEGRMHYGTTQYKPAHGQVRQFG